MQNNDALRRLIINVECYKMVMHSYLKSTTNFDETNAKHNNAITLFKT